MLNDPFPSNAVHVRDPRVVRIEVAEKVLEVVEGIYGVQTGPVLQRIPLNSCETILTFSDETSVTSDLAPVLLTPDPRMSSLPHHRSEYGTVYLAGGLPLVVFDLAPGCVVKTAHKVEARTTEHFPS